MFRHIFEWMEEQSRAIAGGLCGIAAFFWAGTVAVKLLSRTPVRYEWDSIETFGLSIVCGVILVSLVVQLVFYTSRREAHNSVVLAYIAPWVLVVSGLAFGTWLWNGVSPGANLVPLGGTVLLAGLTSYAAWYGFMSEHSGWVRSKTTKVARGGGAGGDGEVVARAKVPKIRFADIFGNDAIKARLLEAGRQIAQARAKSARKDPRNGVLLHGEPGNGKTVFAEALAGELGLPFLQVSVADVASKWVGEKTSRIRAAFDQAIRNQPCLLFIDEVDALLEARNSDRGDGTKEDRDAVNALLTLMVDVRAHRVVLVAATNHLDSLDGAGIREGRFDFKVEITAPDAVARRGLLASGMKSNLPNVRVTDSVLDAVAARWNGFSAKRILAVTEELPSYLNGRTAAVYEDFMGALRVLQGQRGASIEGAKRLSDLVLSAEAKEAIDLIVGRMADPEYTERHGGTLPTGVLLYGPPGTGKTATCKAIAAELGWGFLPSTGAALARKPSELEKLYRKAKELRPTIIFIDEADELLRSRESSPYTEATNLLLTLTEGVGERVKDVVWFVATNHPDQIDPALLRGGRFTEKVLLDLPTHEQLSVHLVRWLSARTVKLADGFTVDDFARAIGRVSIANCEAVAQGALNRAVARRETPVVVTAADAEQAIRLVLA